MKKLGRYYKKSIILTAILYVAVFVLLFSSLSFENAKKQMVVKAPSPKIVQAVAVNQKQVQTEIKNIKARQRAKHKAEIARQKYLRHLAWRAKRARVKEQQRLDNLKSQQAKLERKQKMQVLAAQKRIVKMKQEQQQMQQHLAALQKKRQQIVAKAKSQKQIKQQQILAEKQLQEQIAAEQKHILSVRNSQIASEIGHYKSLILNTIGQKWIVPKKYNKNALAVLLIRLAPGGTVLKVAVLRSSGDSVLDRSVVTAIWKASPLPVPKDALVFNKFRELHLTVRPEGLLG